MKYIAFTTLLILCFTSCKKDKPIDPSSSTVCLDFDIGPDECPWGGPLYKDGSPNYQKPCFNPNNPDEFVYRHGNAVWKHTISSKQSVLVKDGVRPFTQLDWSRIGWITFTSNDWNVWILKDDGSELRMLTQAPRDWGPEFNHSGDRIMYGRSMEYTNYDLDIYPELREQYKIMIIGLDSVPVDSFCRRFGPENLCYPWDFSSWSSDNRIAAEYEPNSTEYGLSIYDLNGNVIEVLDRSDNPDGNKNFIQDVEWHPDNYRVYFTDRLGINVVEISTMDVTTIKESCDSKSYLDISISSDGSSILASREISTYSDCTVTSRMELVLMDINGCNERVVEID